MHNVFLASGSMWSFYYSINNKNNDILQMEMLHLIEADTEQKEQALRCHEALKEASKPGYSSQRMSQLPCPATSARGVFHCFISG